MNPEQVITKLIQSQGTATVQNGFVWLQDGTSIDLTKVIGSDPKPEPPAEPPKPKTIQEAAQLAIDVQDACNLSGVVLAFGRILTETLWPAARESGGGTYWVNQHPISKIFASKISDLTGVNSEPYLKPFTDCELIAKGEPVDSEAPVVDRRIGDYTLPEGWDIVAE